MTKTLDLSALHWFGYIIILRINVIPSLYHSAIKSHDLIFSTVMQTTEQLLCLGKKADFIKLNNNIIK